MDLVGEYRVNGRDGGTNKGRLPVPFAIWTARKAKGIEMAFLHPVVNLKRPDA